MPLGKSGKYFANPAHMKAMGDAPDDQPIPATVSEPGAMDDADPMVQCPSCGDTFPMSQGMPQDQTDQGQATPMMAADTDSDGM